MPDGGAAIENGRADIVCLIRRRRFVVCRPEFACHGAACWQLSSRPLRTVLRDLMPRAASTRPRIDKTLVKALARAFRWRKMLETGAFATVDAIAADEKINASYVGRVLRLTLLAPDIVEAILGGRQPADMTLAVLMRPFAVAASDYPRVVLV